MRTLLVLRLAAATLSLTGCGGTFPIQQLPQHEVTQSQSAIHDAVIKAANERKFMVEKDTPSSVALVYPPVNHGKYIQFHARYRVDIGPHSYEVKYIDSMGLDVSKCTQPAFEDKLCGHRKVNQWQLMLDQAIENLLAYKEPAKK